MTTVIEYVLSKDYDECHRNEGYNTMPMIDVYATSGLFKDRASLATDLANAVMRWEKVPPLNLFRQNTAAFIHELPLDAIRNAAGEGEHVRVQILTPVGVLDREKQLGVVKELTDIVATAASDSTLRERTWVLITESPDGGWGIGGHALLSTEIAQAARDEIAQGSAQ
jgi:phenylpyruvate tautomerase PptA (4-oxalocrotonate tautomerase family)